MTNYTKDAPLLFRKMREKMNRDPADVVQDWQFSFTADRFIAQEPAMTSIKSLMDVMVKVLEPKQLPSAGVSVEEDEQGNVKTMFRIPFKGVMNEAQLAALHQQFQTAGAEHRLNYEGCRCFLKDPQFDSQELFLQQRALTDRDPANVTLSWTFSFTSPNEDVEKSTRALMGVLVETGRIDHDSVSASGHFSEGQGGKIAMVEIAYLGTMSEPVLAQLHQALGDAASNMGIQYGGVNID